MKRTASFDVDAQDFELDVDICKADRLPDGTRILRGVASGVLEDADGERVSKNGILNMARQAVQGIKLVAGSHSQDWHNEIGDVVKLEHDPKHDELLIDTVLPPEGEDPLADKAWNKQTKEGKKLGFSIGGKLEKAYYEISETGKKRRVLDRVRLKHVALTQAPAYRQSFALAVAKTAGESDAPKDMDAYSLDVDEPTGSIIVEKVVEAADVKKASDGSAAQDEPAGNRGTRSDDAPTPDVAGEDADKDKDGAPEGGGERHLACPNCGHEFAAGMPAEQEAPAETIAGDNNDRDAHKRAPESEETVVLDDTIANLRKLVAGGAGDDAEVEKKTDDTNTGLTDVEKLVAASHEAGQESLAAFEERVSKGFEGVSDVLKKIVARLDGQPQGRKSVARAGIPTRAEVEENLGKRDDEEPEDLQERVGKIAAEGDPLKAIAQLNEATLGIPSNYASRATQRDGLVIGGGDL